MSHLRIKCMRPEVVFAFCSKEKTAETGILPMGLESRWKKMVMQGADSANLPC